MQIPKRSFGSILLLSALSACAHQELADGVFDVPQGVEKASTEASVDTKSLKGKPEPPPTASAQTLIGKSARGPGYVVQDTVTSDGRFHKYKITFDQKTYTVTGDALMQKHLRELEVVDQLRKQNKGVVLAKAGLGAVTAPVMGVVNAVSNPIEAGKQSYENVKSSVQSVGEAFSDASDFVVNKGQTEPDLAEREEDGFFEGFLGRPEERRKLAYRLKVDPYTHFVPLQDALNNVAGYQAAGKFSVDTGLGFIPGVGAIVVTGVTTLDDLTKKILVKSPDEMADANRKRLANAGFNGAKIEKFILSPIYTPTEKTLLTGSIVNLKGLSGVGNLLNHAAAQTDRAGAFAVFEEIDLIRQRKAEGSAVRVSVISGVPVLHHRDKSATLIAAYDQIAWTATNAARFADIRSKIRQSNGKGSKALVMVSGNVTKLSAQNFRKYGWKTKENASAFLFSRKPRAQ